MEQSSLVALRTLTSTSFRNCFLGFEFLLSLVGVAPTATMILVHAAAS
nr:hypothetical protein BJQ95_01825 [Cryobacterium sp. SO1]